MTDSDEEHTPSSLERMLVAWERPFVRWVAVALAAGCLLALVISNRSAGSQTVVNRTATVGTPVDLSASASPGAAASQKSSGTVVVDVAGSVRRPGIQRLPAGSRVVDAVAAAGGVKAGQAGVNLARELVDGEQIVVGTTTSAAGLGTSGAAAGTSAKVNLNTATASQLEELPGIGPSKAAKIIEYRSANGAFRSIEQLKEIGGIGDVTFSELSELVSV